MDVLSLAQQVDCSGIVSTFEDAGFVCREFASPLMRESFDRINLVSYCPCPASLLWDHRQQNKEDLSSKYYEWRMLYKCG